MSRRPERLEAIAKNQVLPPMKSCRPSDFPGIHCLREDDRDTYRELRRRWPELEIIYDRSTCLSADAPGHHVYKKWPDGTMTLIASVQRNDLLVWPGGQPAFPGIWLIGALQKQFAPQGSIVEEERKKYEARQRHGAQLQTTLAQEISTYTSAGVNRNNVGKRMQRVAQRKAGRNGKVQARV